MTVSLIISHDFTHKYFANKSLFQSTVRGDTYNPQFTDMRPKHIHSIVRVNADPNTDWTPTGVSSFIMLAGSAAQITDFDGWMLRNWWYELSRERGWQSGTSSSGSSGSAAPASTASAKPTAKALSSAPAAVAATTAATTAAAVSTQPANSGATVGAWAQCGGSGYTGATACVSGFQCIKTNEWYSQCLSA